MRGRVTKNMKVNTKEKSKHGHNSQLLKEDYRVESNCLSREKQTVFSYMGPLAVLAHLALRHKNTLTETMNTRRTATAAEVISMSWPSLVPYQGASTVGQNERDISWDVHHPASGQLLCLWNKRSIGIKLGNLCCTLNIRINMYILLWTGAANKTQSGNDIFDTLITVCNILHQGLISVSELTKLRPGFMTTYTHNLKATVMTSDISFSRRMDNLSGSVKW